MARLQKCDLLNTKWGGLKQVLRCQDGIALHLMCLHPCAVVGVEARSLFELLSLAGTEETPPGGGLSGGFHRA